MRLLWLLLGLVVLGSCGTRVPFTNDLRDEFGLDSEQSLKNVQFYVSSTITMSIVKESGTQGTNESGALVQNSSKDQEEIYIYPGTPGVFEGIGENGEIIVRFEVGVGNVLRFATREGMTSGRFYLLADEWERNKGGRIKYGNREYYATTASGQSYLLVLKKKLQRTKKKRRVVKGMKV
jgi:hypothetical protein